MAENKKSFTAYCDWNNTFNALPDEVAGKLIKHLFAYVNDENPQTDDILINAVFANIKATLKRDLIKWRVKSDKNKENALLRWNKNNANECERIKKDANYADSVSDTDSVSVTVNDTVNVIKDINTATPSKFSFFNSLISLGVEKNLANDWIAVRKGKKLTNTETAFNNLKIEFEKRPESINEIITKCVTESWGGFKANWEWNKNLNNQKNGAEIKYTRNR